MASPTATGPRRRLTTGAQMRQSRRRARVAKRGVIFGVPAALLILAFFTRGWWLDLVRPTGGSATPGADPRRIAVLYLDPINDDKDLSYLADGLTEALIHELSQVKALQVISRNGVNPYKHTQVSPDSIGRALKVGTMVEGTIERSGDRLRVNVALINASNGTEIGSTRLERTRADIFALQDDLAKEVAAFLRARLGQEVQLAEARSGTRNAEAWELVPRAQRLARDAEPLLASGDTAAASRQLNEADSLLTRAEELDDRWITPITQRGWLAYRRSRLSSLDKAYYAGWIDKGMAHADQALKLKSNDADALELRGTLRYWRWLLNLSPDATRAGQLFKDAEQDFRASVAANASQAAAWGSLSHLLANKAEAAESKLAALRAYEADPYLSNADVILWRLFASSYDLDDRVEAVHWCDEGAGRFANDARFAECQIWVLTFEGQKPDIAKAWKLLDKYTQLSPTGLRAFRKLRGQMGVAAAIARAGLADSARHVVAAARGDASVDPTRELSYLEAFVLSILGDRDSAIRLLTTYLASNPQQRATMTRGDSWWFRELRADQRFRALIGSTGP